MNTESGTDMQASEAVETPEKIENNAPISLVKVSNGKFDEEYKLIKNNWGFKELLDKYSNILIYGNRTIILLQMVVLFM